MSSWRRASACAGLSQRSMVPRTISWRTSRTLSTTGASRPSAANPSASSSTAIGAEPRAPARTTTGTGAPATVSSSTRWRPGVSSPARAPRTIDSSRDGPWPVGSMARCRWTISSAAASALPCVAVSTSAARSLRAVVVETGDEQPAEHDEVLGGQRPEPDRTQYAGPLEVAAQDGAGALGVHRSAGDDPVDRAQRPRDDVERRRDCRRVEPMDVVGEHNDVTLRRRRPQRADDAICDLRRPRLGVGSRRAVQRAPQGPRHEIGGRGSHRGQQAGTTQ